jgi:hypothetical protein
MSSVTHSLNDVINKHRVVFWYDPEGEIREEYNEVKMTEQNWTQFMTLSSV